MKPPKIGLYVSQIDGTRLTVTDVYEEEDFYTVNVVKESEQENMEAADYDLDYEEWESLVAEGQLKFKG